MITSDGSKRSEEFGPEGPDAPVDVHWASVFPELPSSEMAQLERRGLGHIFTWLRYQRGSGPVCRATVRLGLLGLYASGHEGSGGVEDRACLVDVIHSKDSTEATALHQTLVVRGWGGANLLTPRSSLRHLTGSVRHGEDLFDNSFIEAYGAGSEPMFVSYPSAFTHERREALRQLAQTWRVTLSPYSNHSRNHELRLSFSEHALCSEAVSEAEAAHFGRQGFDSHLAAVVDLDPGVGSLLYGGGSETFGDLLAALLRDDTWLTVTSDAGRHPDHPCVRVDFPNRRVAEAFAGRI